MAHAADGTDEGCLLGASLGVALAAEPADAGANEGAA